LAEPSNRKKIIALLIVSANTGKTSR